MRWMSVEDDLPPNDVEVMVYGCRETFAGSVYTIGAATFNAKRGWRCDFHAVLYWTAMPPLPAIEEDAPTKCLADEDD